MQMNLARAARAKNIGLVQVFDAAIAIGDGESTHALGENLIATRHSVLESGCFPVLDVSILLDEAGSLIEEESDDVLASSGRELHRIAETAGARTFGDLKGRRKLLATLEASRRIEPVVLAAIRTALRWLSRPVLAAKTALAD